MDGRSIRYLKETAEREGHRRQMTNEARDAMGPFISGLFPVDLFMTATYDRRRLFQECVHGADVVGFVSGWKAQRDGRWFLREASKNLRRNVAGVLAVEAHKDGSAHLHGVLGVGGLQDGDVKRLWALWFKTHGFIRLEEPRSTEDVAGYCAKYLCKDFGELVTSRDLSRQRTLFERRSL